MLVTKHVATRELKIGYACQCRSKPASIQTNMDIEREPMGKRYIPPYSEVINNCDKMAAFYQS